MGARALPRDAVLRPVVPFVGGRSSSPMLVTPVVREADTERSTLAWAGIVERLVNENAALRREVAERDALIITLGATLQKRQEMRAQRASVEALLCAVVDAFGITTAMLKGNRRGVVTDARQMAAALILEAREDLSMTTIGAICGFGDHTGAMHAIARTHDKVRAGRIGAQWDELRQTFGLPPALPERVSGRIWTLNGDGKHVASAAV